MLFKNLFEMVADEASEPPVRFERLRELVNLHHQGVGKILTLAIQYPQPNYQAHYVLMGVDRSSPYEEEFEDAQIRYCEGLDEHPAMRRYALTKELMHVFDTEEERTDTRAKFVSLAREIQNRPLSEHMSPMYKSELATKWMALILLCPPAFRDRYLEPYRQGEILSYEISEALQIPDSLVTYLMDDYYTTALESVLAR
jgi:hypothetical protein